MVNGRQSETQALTAAFTYLGVSLSLHSLIAVFADVQISRIESWTGPCWIRGMP